MKYGNELYVRYTMTRQEHTSILSENVLCLLKIFMQ